MSTSEENAQCSFLVPRQPSIMNWYQRPKLVAEAKAKLLSVFDDEKKDQNDHSAPKIFLRLKHEADPSARTDDMYTIVNDTTLKVYPSKHVKEGSIIAHKYSFSKILNTGTTQLELFHACVHEELKNFIGGQNCLIFAYGTTNAGKTYTVQGNHGDPGIIPRSLSVIFKSIDCQESSSVYRPEGGVIKELSKEQLAEVLEQKRMLLAIASSSKSKSSKRLHHSTAIEPSLGSGSSFLSWKDVSDEIGGLQADPEKVYNVWISFYEIYNEHLYDLLDDKKQKKIYVDANGFASVKELKLVNVSSAEEAYTLMLYGKSNSQVASTKMNANSSRSHCIFTVHLVQYKKGDDPSLTKASTFTFCDLAGAERNDKTENVGKRLDESNKINTSLHVLGRCLTTLRDNQTRKLKHPVPYRQSKLTRLFEKALTGEERMLMIVNISTSYALIQETINVLKFSAVAGQIDVQMVKKQSQVKRSRFSIVARQAPSHPINWETISSVSALSAEESINIMQQKRDNELEEYREKTKSLVRQIESLTQEVTQERNNARLIERSVRKELSDKFNAMLMDLDKKHKEKVERVEQRSEDHYRWHIDKVKEYYEKKLEAVAHKRRRISEQDETINLDETEREVEMETEITDLNTTNNNLKELLALSQKNEASLTADLTSLTFQFSNLQKELHDCQLELQASQASQKEDEDNGNELVQELRRQLDNCKKVVEEKTTSIAELNILLNEAKEEVKINDKEKEDLESQIADLEKMYREKEEKKIDLEEAYETLSAMLNDKLNLVETTEKERDSITMEHERVLRENETLKKKLEEHELVLNENKALKKKLEESENRLSSQLSLVSELENEAKRLQQGLKAALQEKVNTVKRDVYVQACSQIESHKSEISALKGQIKAFEERDRTLEVLNEETIRWKSEVSLLQLEKQNLEDAIKMKDSELENFIANRDQLVSRYETALAKAQEELATEKREVQRMRDSWLGTPTPKKTGERAEIRHLMEKREENAQRIKFLEEQLCAAAVTKPLPKIQVEQHFDESDRDIRNGDQPPSSARGRNKKKLFAKQYDNNDDVMPSPSPNALKSEHESVLKMRLRHRK